MNENERCKINDNSTINRRKKQTAEYIFLKCTGNHMKIKKF